MEYFSTKFQNASRNPGGDIKTAPHWKTAATSPISESALFQIYPPYYTWLLQPIEIMNCNYTGQI